MTVLHVYLTNSLPFHMVDIFLQIDGDVYHNPFTANKGPDLNMVLAFLETGPTPEQVDTLREFARTYEITFHIDVQ